jgi:DNA-binding response OmpR family regulator
MQKKVQLKLLVVDDNEVKAYTLQRKLESAGFTVEVVSSARAAVHATLNGHFAAVLLDIHMPEMTGIDVCASVRAERHGPQPVIILHSATDPTESTIEMGRKVGADAFLAHPIDGQALVALVLHLVQKRTNPSADLLGSWKEIANYFGKGVRTVQRWELDGKMPVYRPATGPTSSSVFADPDELREWALRRKKEPQEPA